MIAGLLLKFGTPVVIGLALGAWGAGWIAGKAIDGVKAELTVMAIERDAARASLATAEAATRQCLARRETEDAAIRARDERGEAIRREEDQRRRDTDASDDPLACALRGDCRPAELRSTPP